MTSLPLLSTKSGALSPEHLPHLARVLEEEQRRRRARNRLATYSPYPKQREFHGAGAAHRERLFMAANQVGKTVAGAFECAMHLTGRYPDWWTGHRFDHPPQGWVGGLTAVTVRDSIQKLLLGDPAEPGTGAIPADAILEPVNSRSAPGALDSLTVRHVSGRPARLGFKAYEQGREKWQAATLDFVWFDEEPSEDIYSEGLTRTNATGGVVWMTFTPLLGMSATVTRFLESDSPYRHVTTMTIDDALHYTPEERERIIAGYAPHEREARARGVPAMGSGRIFPVPEEMISCDAIPPSEIPDHWRHIGGMDFGWDHPAAFVSLLHDPEEDVVYITRTHRIAQQTPILHAAAVRPWGSWLPWAWPHDGLQHDKGSGEQLAEQYRSQGLNLLPERATFEDGTNGVEAGLFEMLDRMQTGRLKVYRHLADWFSEFRIYHREKGKVVKERDDLLSATRYALMMLRYAETAPTARADRYSRYGGSRRASWMGA